MSGESRVDFWVRPRVTRKFEHPNITVRQASNVKVVCLMKHIHFRFGACFGAAAS